MDEIKIGLIGGSGLGHALVGLTDGTRHDVNTPFGRPSDRILETRWGDLPVLILNRHGPGHTLNPSQVPYRANLFALKQLGCTHVLASGAVGSLREEFQPRHLVIPDQLIDKTTRRAGTFFDNAAVHVEFAEPFCPVLRQILLECGSVLAKDSPGDAETPLVVHERGCYVAMEGPAFSTRAESLMHRLWGGDLIGMTAMPEAKLAREAELPYALVALVTDYDCWRVAMTPKSSGQLQPELPPQAPDPHVLLKEILRNLDLATQRGIALIKAAVEKIAADPSRVLTCPARRSLELGIWSQKSAIDPDEVRKLGPLWGRYFESSR
jgi:5'-methylthioadenosine phosphorylase